MSPFALFVALIATAVAAVVLFVVLYALYRLFRWALRLLIGGVELGGLPPFSILVSLTLAATIFSSGAEAVWTFAYRLIRILFSDFPRAVVDIAFGAYACVDTMGRDGVLSSDCLVRTALNLATSIGRFFNNSFSYLDNVTSILQFFAAWAVLAWIFRDLFGGVQNVNGLPMGPRAFYHDMTPEARMRLGLGGVVAIGAYLCLCAIVAVSLFKPAEKLQQLDPTRLKDRLIAARLSNDGADNPFSKRFPEDLGVFPKLADPKITDSSFYQILTTEFAQLTERWHQLRIDIAAEQDRLRELAAADYEIKNLNRVGSREQANHYLALEKWYQTSLTRLFSHLDNCRTAILLVRTSASADIVGRPVAGFDGSDRNPVNVEQSPMGAPVPRSASLPNSPFSVFGSGGFSAVYNARQACQSRPPDLPEVPDRGDFGYALGIMGYLSGWLLRTESMPLALITGLVGFGLFGALVSTFVRAATGHVLQWDIFGVVCRGVSAAIVVFLAAYGGIAVVSQASGDPNPYVVFVTCLVGSVFGEDVWQWARDRFIPPGATAPANPASGAGTAGPRPPVGDASTPTNPASTNSSPTDR